MKRLIGIFLLFFAVCLVQAASDDIYAAPPDAPRANLIQAVATSPTNVCLDGASAAHDCWFSYLCINNTTSGAIAVSGTNVSGTPIDIFTSASIPANTSQCQEYPGGMFFKGGLKLGAGATGLTARGRYAIAKN